MSKLPAGELPAADFRSQRRTEIITFLVLAFGIWPIIAIGVVGGFGFIVWMFQIIYGPPGPPPAVH